jgi:hypothetical protein
MSEITRGPLPIMFFKTVLILSNLNASIASYQWKTKSNTSNKQWTNSDPTSISVCNYYRPREMTINSISRESSNSGVNSHNKRLLMNKNLISFRPSNSEMPNVSTYKPLHNNRKGEELWVLGTDWRIFTQNIRCQGIPRKWSLSKGDLCIVWYRHIEVWIEEKSGGQGSWAKAVFGS